MKTLLRWTGLSDAPGTTPEEAKRAKRRREAAETALFRHADDLRPILLELRDQTGPRGKDLESTAAIEEEKRLARAALERIGG